MEDQPFFEELEEQASWLLELLTAEQLVELCILQHLRQLFYYWGQYLESDLMKYLSLRPCAWLEAIQRLYRLKRQLAEEMKKERM